MLTGTLMGIHQMLAAVTKVPELQLDPKEAAALAASAAEVAKHYPAAVMSPVAVAWTGLASCVAMIYLPRMAVVRMRVAEVRTRRAGGPEAAPELVPDQGTPGIFGAALGELQQAA